MRLRRLILDSPASDRYLVRWIGTDPLSLPLSHNLSFNLSRSLSLCLSLTITHPKEHPTDRELGWDEHRYLTPLPSNLLPLGGFFRSWSRWVRRWEPNETMPITSNRKGTYETRRTCRIDRKFGIVRGSYEVNLNRKRRKDSTSLVLHCRTTRLVGWIHTFRMILPDHFLAWTPNDPSSEDEDRGEMIGFLPFPFSQTK